MRSKVLIDTYLKTRFPKLNVLTQYVDGVKVTKQSVELDDFRKEIVKQVRKEHKLESLKDQTTFRAYRDFFWMIGIDPTKNRPAAEALVRRILAGTALPRINSVVDAYNLASVTSRIALAAFDADELVGSLRMRFAGKGESFVGIGMKKPLILQGGEIVLADDEKLIAIYPYRDAEKTKITEKTRNLMILTCGVPGIQEEMLQKAAKIALEYITRFCT